MGFLFSIDLIICTYNNAPLLQKTLTGLTKLKVPTHIDWGVLLVNNNCTDDTSLVIEDFIKNSKLPLTTVFEKEQGVAVARYSGVKNTGREWIAFIDDDCILGEDWITEAEKFIKQHPSCGMFGSRIKLVFDKKPPPYVLNFPFAYAGKNHGSSPKRMEAVAGAGMVVWRDALEECKWTDYRVLADRKGKQLTSGGDMEIALRVGAHYEVWYNPYCLIDHLIPEQRTTKHYLQRMMFGLGASRHNVRALTWKGSYYLWLPYSAVYSIGLLAVGIADTVKELTGKRTKAGFMIAISPFLGWNAAVFSMLVTQQNEREAILGCAIKRNNLAN